MTAIQSPPIIHPPDPRRLEDEAGIELVNGNVVEKPVSIESSEIEATIQRLLGNEAVKARDARVFGSSMGYRCFPDEPARFRKPDGSLVRADRLANVNPQDGFMPIPADLVVEVLSPNDLAYDVQEKVEDYLAHGFPLIWVVHPNTRSVMIYRATGAPSLLHHEDEITGEAALPTFRCKVAAFFE